MALIEEFLNLKKWTGTKLSKTHSNSFPKNFPLEFVRLETWKLRAQSVWSNLDSDSDYLLLLTSYQTDGEVVCSTDRFPSTQIPYPLSHPCPFPPLVRLQGCQFSSEWASSTFYHCLLLPIHLFILAPRLLPSPLSGLLSLPSTPLPTRLPTLL